MSVGTLRTVAAGSGEPIVMLPGFGVTPNAYRRTIAALAEDHRVVMPWVDPGPGGWALEPLLETLLRTVDAASLERPWLVGHSFGGALALALFPEAGERFSGLILVDSLGVSPGLGQMARLGLNPSNARLLTFDLARDILTFAARRPRQLAGSAWWAFRCELADGIEAIRLSDLARSVMWAEGDGLLPPQLGERLAQELDAPFVLVDAETTGTRPLHDWPMRHPDVFAELVRTTIGQRRIGRHDPEEADREEADRERRSPGTAPTARGTRSG